MNNHIFGRFNPAFEWIYNLAALNLIWVLFNLPVLYLVSVLLFVKSTSQVILLLIPIIPLLPLLTFPSTTALFGVVRKWVMKEDIKIFKSFWQYFKENYKRSLAGGTIITILWVIGIVDYLYFKANAPFVSYLFLFLLAVLFLYTLYFFANTVHTEGNLLNSLKNVMIITIANPFFSFGIAAITFIIVYVSSYYLTFLIPFFTASLVALTAFAGYLKVFNTILNLKK